MHSPTFDMVEYLPLTHPVQVMAPVTLPVLVILPAGQNKQFFTAELSEKRPTEHAMHELAPVSGPVLVRDPFEQTLHAAPESPARPIFSEYRPTGHAMQFVWDVSPVWLFRW
jgi:hypothetical protein